MPWRFQPFPCLHRDMGKTGSVSAGAGSLSTPTQKQSAQSRLRDERERAGGVPGKRLTAPAERAMLEVRLGGLDRAARRGLDAVDADPTVLPVLAMPRAHPVHPPSAGAQAPTPASLASYLTASQRGHGGSPEQAHEADEPGDPELESPPPPRRPRWP